MISPVLVPSALALSATRSARRWSASSKMRPVRRRGSRACRRRRRCGRRASRLRDRRCRPVRRRASQARRPTLADAHAEALVCIVEVAHDVAGTGERATRRLHGARDELLVGLVEGARDLLGAAGHAVGDHRRHARPGRPGGLLGAGGEPRVDLVHDAADLVGAGGHEFKATLVASERAGRST